MAGEDQIPATEDSHPEDARIRRRAAVLPGLVLLAAFLVVAWLIWTYALRPASVTTDSAPPAGVETVTVPDVVGLGEDDAVRVLSDAGFSVNVADSADLLATVGTVAAQEPSGGTSVQGGAVVAIEIAVDSAERDALLSDEDDEVGSGATGGFSPAPVVYVRVPSLVGLSERAALSRARSSGLDPRPMYQPRQDQIGRVYQQDPAPGTRVERGRKVFVLIGSMD